MMKRRRTVLRVFVALFILAIVWAVVSNNPFAQGFQDLVGSKPDHPILDKQFAVAARSFRYYQFDLPQGSKNVAIVGHFTSSAVNNSSAAVGSVSSDRAQDFGSNIEVFVMSESAFADWRKGSTSGLVYESGKVSQGKLQQNLPAGLGTYYVVFSNRFDPGASKNVKAKLLLRYKSWLDWVRRNKAE
jgi:hypothetical protein